MFNEKFYRKIIKKFKISNLNSNQLSLISDKNTIVGHWNLNQISQAIDRKEKFTIIVGFSASGRMHIGSKLVLDNAFELKKYGGQISLPLSDTEAFLTRDVKEDFEETMNQLKKDLIRWKYNLEDTDIYLHSKKQEIPLLVTRIMSSLSIQDFREIYHENIHISSAIAICNMMADIFYPNIIKNIHSVIFLGVDEITHAKLACLVAKRNNWEIPSFIFTKIMNGLKNDKMSKSKPLENVLLSDNPTEVVRKILSHKKYKKNIQEDPLFQIGQWILKIKAKSMILESKKNYSEFRKSLSKKLAEVYIKLD